MPRTLRIGFQGPDVSQLQGQLNAALPTAFPPLTPDGMFGPKTLARVKQFQQQYQLVADGVVGPLTWAALAAAQPKPIMPAYLPPCSCASHGEGWTDPQLASHANEFIAEQNLQLAMSGSGASSDTQPTTNSKGLIIRPVSQTEKDKLKPVYGDSISYLNVFMTNKTGFDNRAFVLTVMPLGVPRMMALQYVNIGMSYTDHTLIHEFGHVWQAQHHSSPTAYLVNAVISQGAAEAANLQQNSKSWSAYAYFASPVKMFANYGAEQIAQMIANGEPGIVSHVKAFPKFLLDPSLLPVPQFPFFANAEDEGVRERPYR